MAIQQINLGSAPSGAGGDTQRAANTKINQNFSNSTHAASRLVGASEGQIPKSEDVPEAYGTHAHELKANDITSVNDLPIGRIKVSRDELNLTEYPAFMGSYAAIHTYFSDKNTGYKYQVAYPYTDGGTMGFRNKRGSTWQDWVKVYTSGNTITDSNKNIKTSSPVVRVFSDHLDKIHEANDLPIKYTRNGVGDYTIEGTTGLRENDWQIVIPKDDHDNQLIAFTMEDDNGTIRLKTYKRIFSMETFTFGPDLSTPLDIPEGRWVDLHFNDLPQEQLDEPIE